MLNEIEEQARAAVTEFLDKVPVRSGQILVIGCSSSEICGKNIGSASSVETADAVFGAIYPFLKEKGIYLAAQCCEHLNRAVILESEAAEKYGLPIVNAVPQPKAGGSFATAAYHAFQHPAAVERVQAHAGMDIGDTLIGMHLRPVAVPVRLSVKKIGEANLVCARTRPKYIGGERAHYDPELG